MAGQFRMETSASALRFPPVKKLNYVFRANARGRFELAFFLAHHQLAVGIEDGQAWDPLFQRDFVFPGVVQIFVVVADIDMDHVVVRVHEGSKLRRPERRVEDMAVVTPVPAEY